jgi:cytochrome c biogenesis protein CcmG/thiol:disulfide interchange protein DsbE
MTEATLPRIDPQETPESEQPNRLRMVVLIIGGPFLFGLMLVFAWSLQDQTSSELFNSPAPPFNLTTFEGETISLAELEGQVVVLNFWASWCVECYDEAPLLEEAYQTYKDQGVIFVGIAYLDTLNESLGYMEEYGITYPSGLDVGTKISRDYFITGVPETFIINADGTIHHVQIGPIERGPLFTYIDQALAQQGSF